MIRRLGRIVLTCSLVLCTSGHTQALRSNVFRLFEMKSDGILDFRVQRPFIADLQASDWLKHSHL